MALLHREWSQAREPKPFDNSFNRAVERTESHLNEWNYLPGNTWKPISKTGSPEERESFYVKMAGPPGAAFLATTLIELQDAPVDVCNLFHGELGGFGSSRRTASLITTVMPSLPSGTW